MLVIFIVKGTVSILVDFSSDSCKQTDMGVRAVTRIIQQHSHIKLSESAQKSGLNKHPVQIVIDSNEVNLGNNMVEIEQFNDLCYLGETDVFFKRNRQNYAVASEECHLMILSRTELEGIIQDEFPHVYQELQKASIMRQARLTARIDNMSSLFKSKSINRTIDQNLMDDRTNTKSATGLNKAEDLYYKSLTAYPIEDLIGEEACLNPSLTFDEVNSRGIELLYNQYEELKETIVTQQQIETKTKADLEIVSKNYQTTKKSISAQDQLFRTEDR